MHSYTLMCNVCTDSIQEQLTPKNTSHSTMLSENDTFFTVLKNTEKERVQVLGMTNWKDIAQIFLQRVSEQILSSSLQCKCAFSYSYAVEYHKPRQGSVLNTQSRGQPHWYQDLKWSNAMSPAWQIDRCRAPITRSLWNPPPMENTSSSCSATQPKWIQTAL